MALGAPELLIILLIPIFIILPIWQFFKIRYLKQRIKDLENR